MFHRRRMLWLIVAVVPLAAAGGVWYAASPGPPEPGKRFRQALAALERGELGAVAEAATAIEADRQYAAHVDLLDAGVLLRRGQPGPALARLSRLELAGELREPGLLLMGESLYGLGRLAEAEVVFRQLARESPAHADAHRWLGAIYFDLGANNAAITELKRVIELDPRDYAPHRLIGLMFYDFEENVQAIEHYRRALELDPPPPVREDVLRELAKALIAERHYAEALQAIEAARTDATVLALRAECYWSLGRREDARQALRQAEAYDPQERLLALLKSRILMEDAKPGAAAAVLTRVIQRNPHDAECRYQLAQAYGQLGDRERHASELARWQESADLQRRLTELNIKAIDQPRNASVREQIADVCQALGKDKLAEAWRAAARACRRQAQVAPRSVRKSSSAENDSHGGT